MKDLRDASDFRRSGGIERLVGSIPDDETSVEAWLETALNACRLDPECAFDFAAAGGNFVLKKLMDTTNHPLAFEVASFSHFPSPASSSRRPFPIEFHGLLLQRVHAKQSAQRDTGFALWPAARLLALALPSFVDGEDDVLELGAGLGLAGLAACALAKTVTLTDYNRECLDMLEYNVDLNRITNAKVEQYDFSSPPPPNANHTKIIASDVICCDEDAEAVAFALSALLSDERRALFCLASPQNRYGVSSFPRYLDRNNLAFTTTRATRSQADRAGLADDADYLEWDFYHISKPS